MESVKQIVCPHDVGDALNYGDSLMCWCGHEIFFDNIPESVFLGHTNMQVHCGDCGGRTNLCRGMIVEIYGPYAPYCVHGFDLRSQNECSACRSNKSFSPYVVPELH